MTSWPPSRARHEALQADPVGREGEGHGRGQLGDGVRGHVLAEAEPSDQDGHARGRTRPARQRAGRTGVDDRRPGPVGADFREHAVPRSLNEPGVGRGIKRDRRIGNTDDQRGRRAGAVRPHDRDPGGGLHLRRAALRCGDSAGPSCARAPPPASSRGGSGSRAGRGSTPATACRSPPPRRPAVIASAAPIAKSASARTALRTTAPRTRGVGERDRRGPPSGRSTPSGFSKSSDVASTRVQPRCSCGGEPAGDSPRIRTARRAGRNNTRRAAMVKKGLKAQFGTPVLAVFAAPLRAPRT
jgi:hypothetical protein